MDIEDKVSLHRNIGAWDASAIAIGTRWLQAIALELPALIFSQLLVHDGAGKNYLCKIGRPWVYDGEYEEYHLQSSRH